MALYFALLSLGVGPLAFGGEAQTQKEKSPEIILSNEVLLLHLRVREPGISLITLKNLSVNLTIAPDQGLAPFVLKDAEGNIFSAYKDFLSTRVTSTRRSAMIEFRGQGILLSGRLEITLGRSTSFWELFLHNSSASDWIGEVYFPLITCPQGANKESFVWWGQDCGQKALWSTLPSLEVVYGQSLSVPAFLLASKGGGFLGADNGRWDLLKVPALARSRAFYAGPTPGASAPGDSLRVISWKQQLVIPSGEDRVVGPIVLGAYRGQPEEGLAELTPIRRRLVRTLPPGPLSKVGVLYRDPSTIPQGATVVLSNALTWTPEGRLVGSPLREGNTGLRRYLRSLHNAGNQVLLELPVLGLPSQSPFALSDLVKEWRVRLRREEESVESPLLPLCPAAEGWRKLLAREMVRVIRVTGADGFLLRWRQAFRSSCYRPSHQHPSPFIGSWGLRQVFEEMNSYFAQEQVKPILLAEGPSDVIADFVEGFVVTPPSPAGLFFRSLYPQKRLYVEVPLENLSLSTTSLALSLGMGLLLPSSEEKAPSSPLSLSPVLQRYQDLLKAYPEFLSASPLSEGLTQSPEGLQAQIWRGAHLWLSLFNPSRDLLQGKIRFTFPVAFLKDPLTGLVLEPGTQGEFIIGVMGEQMVLWEILTAPTT